jgi:hypothetical protein
LEAKEKSLNAREIALQITEGEIQQEKAALKAREEADAQRMAQEKGELEKEKHDLEVREKADLKKEKELTLREEADVRKEFDLKRREDDDDQKFLSKEAALRAREQEDEAKERAIRAREEREEEAEEHLEKKFENERAALKAREEEDARLEARLEKEKAAMLERDEENKQRILAFARRLKDTEEALKKKEIEDEKRLEAAMLQLKEDKKHLEEDKKNLEDDKKILEQQSCALKEREESKQKKEQELQEMQGEMKAKDRELLEKEDELREKLRQMEETEKEMQKEKVHIALRESVHQALLAQSEEEAEPSANEMDYTARFMSLYARDWCVPEQQQKEPSRLEKLAVIAQRIRERRTGHFYGEKLYNALNQEQIVEPVCQVLARSITAPGGLSGPVLWEEEKRASEEEGGGIEFSRFEGFPLLLRFTHDLVLSRLEETGKRAVCVRAIDWLLQNGASPNSEIPRGFDSYRYQPIGCLLAMGTDGNGAQRYSEANQVGRLLLAAGVDVWVGLQHYSPDPTEMALCSDSKFTQMMLMVSESNTVVKGKDALPFDRVYADTLTLVRHKAQELEEGRVPCGNGEYRDIDDIEGLRAEMEKIYATLKLLLPELKVKAKGGVGDGKGKGKGNGGGV